MGACAGGVRACAVNNCVVMWDCGAASESGADVNTRDADRMVTEPCSCRFRSSWTARSSTEEEVAVDQPTVLSPGDQIWCGRRDSVDAVDQQVRP